MFLKEDDANAKPCWTMRLKGSPRSRSRGRGSARVTLSLGQPDREVERHREWWRRETPSGGGEGHRGAVEESKVVDNQIERKGKLLNGI